MVYTCLARQMCSEVAVFAINHNCGARGEEIGSTGIAASRTDYGYEDARRIDDEQGAREAIALGLTP